VAPAAIVDLKESKVIIPEELISEADLDFNKLASEILSLYKATFVTLVLSNIVVPLTGVAVAVNVALLAEEVKVTLVSSSATTIVPPVLSVKLPVALRNHSTISLRVALLSEV